MHSWRHQLLNPVLTKAGQAVPNGTVAVSKGTVKWAQIKLVNVFALYKKLKE